MNPNPVDPTITNPRKTIPPPLQQPTSGNGGESDRQMLEGPRSRTSEFVQLLRIMRDFLRGFRVLHFTGPCVTVFGSARTLETNPHYQLARQMGAAISRLGFTVMTGGGAGIMEAANRGAKEAGGRSIGCNIELAVPQLPNAYLDRCVTMHYFFVRKTLLIKYSYAFVVMPGGVGTVDELFEAAHPDSDGKNREASRLLSWAPSIGARWLIHPEDGPPRDHQHKGSRSDLRHRLSGRSRRPHS